MPTINPFCALAIFLPLRFRLAKMFVISVRPTHHPDAFLSESFRKPDSFGYRTRITPPATSYLKRGGASLYTCTLESPCLRYVITAINNAQVAAMTAENNTVVTVRLSNAMITMMSRTISSA